MTAADSVVQALVVNGTSVVFALPGEENLPVVSALRRAGLPMVVCRHEQHAGFMAVAHARLTGSPAVCLATLGPGALNLFTSLAQAQLMRVPVIAITGQKAQIGNEEGSFQVLDVVGAARQLVSWATTVRDPARAATVVGEAFRRATTPPAGAVMVELPEDVAAAEVDNSTAMDGAPIRSVEIVLPVASGAAVTRLVERIEASERPLLLVGSGTERLDLAGPLRRLCEQSGLSVLATQMGKGALAETHPRSLRSLGIHRPDHAHMALDAADLVVAVGYTPTEHPPLAWQQDRRLPIVHVDQSPAAREAGYEPEFDIVGELVSTIDRLAESGLCVATAWSDDARRRIETALDAEAGPHGVVDPLSVVRIVNEVGDASDVVALDNGAYKIWFARQYPAAGPHSLLLDNATASMGAGLATATEAARLGRRALAVVGDGGLMMNVGDLETAVRLGVDLTVLVLRDDAYGFIAWHQDEQGRARHGVKLGNPDLVKLVDAFGGSGTCVASPDELRRALEWARTESGLTLIDCVIDYSINEIL